jgi:pimeloyl-ACP methyl ester carboxylesterase
MTTIEHVTSADGTTIAYERAGTGRPIVFSAGIFNDRHRLAPLAQALAGDFTTISYDRRARGSSGDTRPYGIDREVEDLAALIDRLGEPAVLFGYSSGAILGLYAAQRLPIAGLIAFEPPFATGEARDKTLPERLDALVAAGRYDEVVETAQAELIGLSPEMIAGAKASPFWPALTAMAQSVVYDATIVTELARPTPELTTVDVPVLILHGAGTWPALKQAAADLASAMPGAQAAELADGAHHDVPVESTAAAVRPFASSAADG